MLSWKERCKICGHYAICKQTPEDCLILKNEKRKKEKKENDTMLE